VLYFCDRTDVSIFFRWGGAIAMNIRIVISKMEGLSKRRKETKFLTQEPKVKFQNCKNVA